MGLASFAGMDTMTATALAGVIVVVVIGDRIAEAPASFAKA
jgi:hypothetical protein